MKRFPKILAGMLGACMALLLCSCESVSDQPEDEYSVFQKGFASGMGNEIVESPDGFYMFNGSFLTFMDKDLENPITVCDKPECRHEEEGGEHAADCNAFFHRPTDIKYYNGRLYIAADDSDGEHQAVYQVDSDGNNKKKLYTSEALGSFIFIVYKGDIIAYEDRYTETQRTAVLIRFPIDDPQRQEVLFSGESTEVKNSVISYLNNDGDTLYFTFINDDVWSDLSFYKADLTSNRIMQICKEADVGLTVGTDRLIGTKNIEKNADYSVWTDKYYQFKKDGTLEREITEADYAALSRGAGFTGADEEYVYLSDICYGPNALSPEERYHFVYTYDGKEVGRIRQTGTNSWFFYPGSDEYAVIQDYDGSEVVLYKADKSVFADGETAEPVEFFRYDPTEFTY